MPKNGKLKKFKNNNKIRTHIKIIDDNEDHNIYHIFDFNGDTIICVQKLNNHDYLFYKSNLNVLNYSNTLKSSYKNIENFDEKLVFNLVQKIKSQIISDIKTLDRKTANDYLHYAYEIENCERLYVGNI